MKSKIKLFFMAVWSIIWITASALLVIFTFGLKRKLAVRWAHTIWSPGILKIAGVRLKVTGLENINSRDSYIFVANHESFIDIPVIFCTIPTNLYFVAKKEIKKLPFIGWYMWLTGMIFVDRSNRQKAYESMKKAGDIIKSGKNVITFPEGTRSNGEIGLFKKGSFLIAVENDIPIVPITLKHAGKVWPSKTAKVNSGKIIVDIAQPISTDKLKAAEVLQLANSVRDQIEKTQNILCL